jgi:hypothetical protein
VLSAFAQASPRGAARQCLAKLLDRLDGLERARPGDARDVRVRVELAVAALAAEAAPVRGAARVRAAASIRDARRSRRRDRNGRPCSRCRRRRRAARAGSRRRRMNRPCTRLRRRSRSACGGTRPGDRRCPGCTVPVVAQIGRDRVRAAEDGSQESAVHAFMSSQRAVSPVKTHGPPARTRRDCRHPSCKRRRRRRRAAVRHAAGGAVARFAAVALVAVVADGAQVEARVVEISARAMGPPGAEGVLGAGIQSATSSMTPGVPSLL